MLKYVPILLVAATIVFLGTFGWLEHKGQLEEIWATRHAPIHVPIVNAPTAGSIERDIAPVPKLDATQWMQVIISIALVIAALFVILNMRYGPKDKHWAYGIIGTIVGFWFSK